MSEAVKAGKGADDFRQVAEELQAALITLMQQALEQAFREREELFVHAMAKRLLMAGFGTSAARRDEVGQDEWVGIESLSGLRSMVGGRFQNIKQKWIAAGFPLREHRGDRSGSFTLDEDGWIDLSSWISKQGFDVRLSGPEGSSFFELRPRK